LEDSIKRLGAISILEGEACWKFLSQNILLGDLTKKDIIERGYGILIEM